MRRICQFLGATLLTPCSEQEVSGLAPEALNDVVAQLRCDSTPQLHRREDASSYFISSDASQPEPSPSTFALAQQGARANATVRHAACFRRGFEMKLQNVNRSDARGAPAGVVAHL